jgi:hypothetical protein
MSPSSSGDPGRAPSIVRGRWRLSLIALALAPVLAACPANQGSDLGHGEAPFVENPALRRAVESLLEQAKKDKSWGSDDRQKFLLGLAPLSNKSRRELSLELAGLISSNQLVIRRDTTAAADPSPAGDANKPAANPAPATP